MYTSFYTLIIDEDMNPLTKFEEKIHLYEITMKMEVFRFFIRTNTAIYCKTINQGRELSHS